MEHLPPYDFLCHTSRAIRQGSLAALGMLYLSTGMDMNNRKYADKLDRILL